MGCCGGREEELRLKAEQKWDYINLNDFNTYSCWVPISYAILYINVLLSIAVYALDTFTAVNLLAFSRWSSQIQPKIPLYISKWIFAGCIILSLVLLVYRWLRAIRVIKSGGIAQCYLDPIAVRVQSIRTSRRASGWRRFLVFAELTKSRKGADYVAIFTYFNFEAWLRVIFAQGPRQVINGITLYSVAQLNLIPVGEHAAPKGTLAIAQFFINIEALAEKNTLQALILFSMLFTLVIWVFEFISFCLSVLMYLLFLWHHIPSEDGTLSAYCRRKINRRLERIVSKKVDKALAQAVVLQDRYRANTDPESGIKRNPTLPILTSAIDSKQQPKLPDMHPLSRQATVTTLPPYRSHTSNPDRQVDYQHQQHPLPQEHWGDHRDDYTHCDRDYDEHGHGHDHDYYQHNTPGSESLYYTEDVSASLVDNAGGIAYSQPSHYQTHQPQQQYQRDPMQREFARTPMLPPVERYGTPLSLSTGFQGQGQGRSTPGPQTPSSFIRNHGTWEATEVPNLPSGNIRSSTMPTLPSISRPATAFAPPSLMPTPAPSHNRDREHERHGLYDDGLSMSSAPTPMSNVAPRNFARPLPSAYEMQGRHGTPVRSETAPITSNSQDQGQSSYNRQSDR